MFIFIVNKNTGLETGSFSILSIYTMYRAILQASIICAFVAVFIAMYIVSHYS